MESRSQELDAAGQKLEEVQNKTAAMEKVLATYRRLEPIGSRNKIMIKGISVKRYKLGIFYLW